ncbi:MAG: hypothetical protein E7296_04935 [Lachnospiraceae bacterium]|jgi:two-component system sensor histidine kinase YesM|nr:hypothetical protein [Lachnospiraceae bacterium]
MVNKSGSERRQKKKNNTLSTRINRVVLTILILIIISFLVSIYIITERERKEYEIREAENTIKTLSSNINSELESYMELSRLIMMEDRLVKFLRAEGTSVDIGMINDARYGIMDILNVTGGVDSVIVIRDDLIMARTNRFTYKFDYNKLSSDEWKQDILDKKGKAVISLNSNGIATKQDGKPVVTIGRTVYDNVNQKKRGVMLMNISANVLDIMLNELRYDNICILGEDGSYLAGNRSLLKYYDSTFDRSTVYHEDIKENGEKIIISGAKVENTPIIILRVSNFGTQGIPYSILFMLCVLLLIFLVGMTYLGGFVTRNITDPVSQLSESMERNKASGELKPIETHIPEGELNELKNDYNSLIGHVNELIETLLEQEKTLQKAEMRVLQEQIKPHFLYNSIETIGFLALDAGADNVHDALETLGSFYRNFLSKGGREIPLSREISIVKDYLSLQALRYGDIINAEYDISPETETVVVPKLILQPLVENSIYHGIRLKGEKGLIKISSFMKDGMLHLIVRDTGVGMTEEEIEGIFETSDDDNEDQMSKSFGLRGTIERLRIYNNSEDVVRIRSEVGEYTEIEFMIKDSRSGE